MQSGVRAIGKQQGVGEVEDRVDLGGLELARLLKGRHGAVSVAALVVVAAGVGKLKERVLRGSPRLGRLPRLVASDGCQQRNNDREADRARAWRGEESSEES